MNLQLIYLIFLVMACINSYWCGQEAERNRDGWSLVFMLLAFLNFFVGLGGLLNA